MLEKAPVVRHSLEKPAQHAQYEVHEQCQLVHGHRNLHQCRIPDTNLVVSFAFRKASPEERSDRVQCTHKPEVTDPGFIKVAEDRQTTGAFSMVIHSR